MSISITKRSILTLASIALCAVLAPSAAEAGKFSYATATEFKVTFLKFELQKDDGTLVTVHDTPVTVDIAQQSPGAIAETLANKEFPAGTYTNLRVTVSKDMTIAGKLPTATVGTYVTTGNINQDGSLETTNFGQMQPTPANITMKADLVLNVSLGTLVIAQGQDYGTVDVDVNLNSALLAIPDPMGYRFTLDLSAFMIRLPK